MLLALGVAAAAMLMPLGAASAFDGSHQSTTTMRGSGEGDDCASVWNVTFDHRQVYRAEETRTIAPGSISKLSLLPSHNGGVEVDGWDRNEISVKACKAAAGSSADDARRKLDAIKLKINGGEVTADGPDNEEQWAVHLYVRVPANINLEARAHNGPIGLYGVSGTVRAETVNGPISVEKCSGTITADAQNGPISLSGSSGKVHIAAHNGPVDVKLREQKWTGEGLEASTQNGPLHLQIPSSFQSGVEVVSDGHSPFRCENCKEENRTWDDSGMKKARFGAPGAPVIVRMSTVNGPVQINGGLD